MSIKIYNLIKQTAGGFHSWVDSSVGVIRKPNNKIDINENDKIETWKGYDETFDTKLGVKKSWFLRVWEWVKRVFHY